MNLTGWQ